MRILSIESSCDDSALAYTDKATAELLWHAKISQEDTHKIYGGVVPELASRLFARDLPYLLDNFKERFGFSELSHIAITYEPGLSTSLLEGIMMAKALALSLHIPLLGINHLKGHIYSLFINKKEEIFPLSVLLVSGGHTMIIECFNYKDMHVALNTLDDSFGECYDKAAKMLGLGYPGGLIIDNLAQNAQKEGITPRKLPIPLSNQNTLAFSFSGLKNAFRLQLQETLQAKALIDSAILLQNQTKQENKQNISLESQDTTTRSSAFTELLAKIQANHEVQALALGLQESATNHLIQKTKKYFLQNNTIKHFAIVGGASANSMLRAKMSNLCKQFQKELLTSDLQYCSDNAAMIGRAAIAKINDMEKKNIKQRSLLDDILSLEISPRNTEIHFPKTLTQ